MEKTLFYLCIIVLTARTIYAVPSLTMVPAKPILMVFEGDKLELKCSHEYEKGPDDTPRPVSFLKDDELMNAEYQIISSVDGKVWTDTYTYTKEKVTMTDTAVYKCTLASGDESSIRVYVYRVAPAQNVDLVENAPSLTLTCNIETSDIPAIASNYEIAWARNNETLKNGDKYKMENGTLQIMTPERADMGEYQCKIIFFPDSVSNRHTISPKPLAVRAPPAIDSHANNKNLVQGDELELKCKVSGYPLPSLKWNKDGMAVNKSKKGVHLEAYNGVENGKLTIYSLDYDDEGMYSCVATNDVEPFNATATMRLRVKDKLAALWPFLGIVAEVIILCAIILCYEKSRSKKLNDDDDGTDGNVENTVDHRDVRHRRT